MKYWVWYLCLATAAQAQTGYLTYAAGAVPAGVTAADLNSGNVGIGTQSPVHPLQVMGTIGAEEVIVSSNGQDYVFQPGYQLMPLAKVAEYVRQHRHLPDIPSAKKFRKKA